MPFSTIDQYGHREVVIHDTSTINCHPIRSVGLLSYNAGSVRAVNLQPHDNVTVPYRPELSSQRSWRFSISFAAVDHNSIPLSSYTKHFITDIHRFSTKCLGIGIMWLQSIAFFLIHD